MFITPVTYAGFEGQSRDREQAPERRRAAHEPDSPSFLSTQRACPAKLCQRVEITGTGNGPVVRAEARGPDFYAALAAALAKLRTRLHRSHVHHGHRTPTSVAEATGTLGRVHETEVTT